MPTTVVTGRTGADAIFIALKGICRVITKYQTKLLAAIDLCKADGIITTQQQTDAKALVNLAAAACTAFDLIAGYVGF